MRKILFWIVAVAIVIVWPISFIKDPPRFKTETIFANISSEDQRILRVKMGLDHGLEKVLFYNKLTIYKDRYLGNLGVFFDINNYFFAMHPREDGLWVGYRDKFPFWSVIFLIPGLIWAVEKKRILLWFIFGVGLIVSLFRNYDGFDVLVYIPLSWILIEGKKKLWSKK